MLKGRLEDQRMLTGRGSYVSDWNLPGQAYAHFLRSDRAHAQIVSIDKSEALRSAGVLTVYTGDDLKSLKSLPAALPVKGCGGMELIHPGRPPPARRGACAGPATRPRWWGPRAPPRRRTQPSASRSTIGSFPP